ncbi:cyclase family protein [Kineosporia sp. J2-2]|uniref:Cyclase family protein n=1 Tax=Kineosporia corallincola TaxID=2835133 RepID=A0ABS5TNB0_9ACTN|nr:cyclase family protein [Kineosporia corallincola]MBT0772480.1 cyclase family protein [Kineosporia corallincola]
MIPRRLRTARKGIPQGFGAVDPRTATRVPLGHELSGAVPVFEGDPAFRHHVWTTIAESGFAVEQITSLGTHLGTHLDAPSHFVEGAADLAGLDESWTLMPLCVVDARDRGPDYWVSVPRLRSWERRYGRIPVGALFVLRTGLSACYLDDPGRYAARAPGFGPETVEWLFTARRVRAVGSDTLGPDLVQDQDYRSTRAALRNGGVVLANLGPGLERMRPHGDWVAVNGPRPAFSGFPVGVTGFTVP